MFDLLRKNPKYLVGAIIVHLFFIVLFGVGFHLKSQERAATTAPQTVTVKTIDEKLVEKELKQLQQQDEQEAKRQQDIVKKREAEERRLEELKQKRLKEQENEKKRLAILEKKEKELKEKQRQEEERLKELERKRKEQEAADKVKREDELREKMLAEQKRIEAEQEALAVRQAELKKRQSTIDKYMSLIETKIYQHWIKPPSNIEGKEAVLDVRLIPTGEVISIELSKSSGDPVYDQSVIAAVKRASPLPLPPVDTGLYDVFRHLNLPIRADKKT
jgi:colicin import membrane protein